MVFSADTLDSDTYIAGRHYNTEICHAAVLPFSGSRDGVATGSQDKLKFEALVHMKGTSVLNDEYPFGVGVEIDGSEVWVGTLNVTAALEDPVSVC